MPDVISGRKRSILKGRPAMRVSPAVQRRRNVESAQLDAKSRFPNLDAKLDQIAKGIREARLSGQRFAYKKPLRDLYEMAYDWNKADRLKKRVGYVAALRAIPVRANANSFSVLVRAVLDADAERRNVSRWSVPLEKALHDGVAPRDLNGYI
jgi:hypothetical protein